KDGTIDVIATDHAPHHYDAKEREFDDAPFGIVGLETALGLGLTELVRGGPLTLREWIDRVSPAPPRVLHLPGGSLQRGAPGDVVVVDPDASWRVDPAAFYSNRRTPPVCGR